MARPPEPVSRWVAAGAFLTTLLASLAGLSGIQWIADFIRGPQPVPESCTTYWNEIRELKAKGFTGFDLMDSDSELDQRCGSPSRVADSWPDK